MYNIAKAADSVRPYLEFVWATLREHVAVAFLVFIGAYGLWTGWTRPRTSRAAYYHSLLGSGAHCTASSTSGSCATSILLSAGHVVLAVTDVLIFTFVALWNDLSLKSFGVGLACGGFHPPGGNGKE